MPDQNIDFREVYIGEGAYWEHGGNSADPHALLSKGGHSNGFFNSRLVCANEAALEQAADALLAKLAARSCSISEFSLVAGPQKGATKLVKMLAERRPINWGLKCDYVSPKKPKEGEPILLSRAEKVKVKGQKVLLCEDVVNTGGSSDDLATALLGAGAILLPYTMTLVNRNKDGHYIINGRTIISLIHQPMSNWKSEECPLCTGGSKAVRPKDNWAKLTAN